MAKKKSDQSQVVLYQTPDGRVTVNVMFARDNFWMTQRTMADLFGVNVPAVNKHLKNIYASGELTPGATISKMEIAQIEGGRQISREIAVAKAHGEFERYRVKQNADYISDFDQALAQYLKGKDPQ